MVKTQRIDPEQLKADAMVLRDVVTEQAGRAAERAADLAGQGIGWAAPHVQHSWEKTVEKATPVISEAAARAQEAADQAKPFLDDVHGRVVDDYLPRINKAVADASAAATTDADLAERARLVREASTRALTTPTVSTRKRHRVAKAFGWTALGVSAAGLGYLLWRRSQPIEDPWAEEYWADLETENPVPDVPVEKAHEADTPDEADKGSEQPTPEA